MKQKGFTLIELLVVVAIIGILAAVGVVAYNGYTSAAKKRVCIQNHKLFAKMIVEKWTLCQLQESIVLKNWKSHGATDKTISCAGINMQQMGYAVSIHFTNVAVDVYNPTAHWGYSISFNSGSPSVSNKNTWGKTYCHWPNANTYRLRTMCEGELTEDIIKGM